MPPFENAANSVPASVHVVSRIGDRPDLTDFAETAFDAGVAEGAFPPDCASTAAHYSAAYVELADGVAGMATYYTDGGPDLWVDKLWVAPKHRGQGIGTRLLKAIAAEAERNGLLTVISVRSSNPGAMRLYSRLGFVAESVTISRKPRTQDALCRNV